MNIDIETNLEEFKTEIQQRVENIERNQKEAMSEAIKSLYATSKAALTRLIYQKDIPRRKRTGRIAWRRTYALLRAEKFSIDRSGKQGEIFTNPESRASRYARARHELNQPSPIDGKTRRAPWREKAHEEGQQRAIDRYREVISQDVD